MSARRLGVWRRAVVVLVRVEAVLPRLEAAITGLDAHATSFSTALAFCAVAAMSDAAVAACS
jgi:hypothetical protein